MSEAADDRRVPWLLWPFVLLWRLVTGVLALTGRLLCSVLGVALVVVGVLLTLSIVGAPAGIPLTILGVLLLLRALF